MPAEQRTVGSVSAVHILLGRPIRLRHLFTVPPEFHRDFELVKTNLPHLWAPSLPTSWPPPTAGMSTPSYKYWNRINSSLETAVSHQDFQDTGARPSHASYCHPSRFIMLFPPTSQRITPPMKTNATTVLLGVGAVAAMVLLPRGAHAQPTSDGGPPDGGPPDGEGGGGGPPEVDTDSLVYCPEDGSNAHYDEFLE